MKTSIHIRATTDILEKLERDLKILAAKKGFKSYAETITFLLEDHQDNNQE